MYYTHFFLSCAELSLTELWSIKLKSISFKNAYRQLARGRFSQIGNIKEEKMGTLKRHYTNFNPYLDLDNIMSKGINLVTFDDRNYPEPLKHIYRSPLGLYCRGNIQVFNNYEKFLAMVGPRSPSNYGLQVSILFGKRLAAHGLILVSGLALGIDSIAHKSAIECGIPTIAVLGSNIFEIYPPVNRGLAQKIIHGGGLIISEISPAISSQRFHFAQRNRIISGLSRAVFIVEAREKSGGLITAASAFRQDREVYTVSNSIFEKTSVGTNRLIERNIAKLIFSPDTIIQDLGIALQKKPVDCRISMYQDLSLQEKAIFNLLGDQPVSLEFISATLKIETHKIMQILSTLEFIELISHCGFGKYVRKAILP